MSEPTYKKVPESVEEAKELVKCIQHPEHPKNIADSLDAVRNTTDEETKAFLVESLKVFVQESISELNPATVKELEANLPMIDQDDRKLILLSFQYVAEMTSIILDGNAEEKPEDVQAFAKSIGEMSDDDYNSLDGWLTMLKEAKAEVPAPRRQNPFSPSP